MVKIGKSKAYNVQESAQMLNVSAPTIRNYIKAGKLKAQRLGRSLHITEDELERFVNGDKNDDK